MKYDIGEIVLMERAPELTGEPKKLQPKYRGPLVALEVLSGDTYKVAQLKEQGEEHYYLTTVHVSQLKPYSNHNGDKGIDEEELEDEEIQKTRDSNNTAVMVKEAEEKPNDKRWGLRMDLRTPSMI